MAVEHRDLTPGQTLVARYKGTEYRCQVQQNRDGKLVFVFPDGTAHKSPSAAGSAVMGGISCNGLRFWSLEGTLAPARTPKETPAEPVKGPKAAKPTASKARKPSSLFKRLKNQEGVPDGQTRWFCSACMDAFDAPTGETPTTCPQGHTDQPLDTAAA